MTGKVPDCIGLSEKEARIRLSAAGHRVCVSYYEGYRALRGADGFCVARQMESTDAGGSPVIELIMCNFKRGIAEL